MAGNFQLTVVTPQRLMLQEEAERVAVRTSEGEIGILYDHSPLVTPLGVGLLRAKVGKEYRPVAISGGGFLEILPEKVTVLADRAEYPEEIDVDRAQQAKEKAEKRLAGHRVADEEEINFTRARSSLMRALTRLEAAKWVGETSQYRRG